MIDKLADDLMMWWKDPPGNAHPRAGHTGTLDPRASKMVVLLGPQRLSEYISNRGQALPAEIPLGQSMIHRREGIGRGRGLAHITGKPAALILPGANGARIPR